MVKNYASLAFTTAVKKLQETYGSRTAYSRMEKFNVVDGLTPNEIALIKNIDSFYLASIGTNNYPYIQHRGGPKGFLKVLDTKRIGFIDFTGNKQYISTGNIETNANVSLILVHYPTKTRLKIYAKAAVLMLNKHTELYQKLDLNDYDFTPERMLVFSIEAYDWNCPQHITPRYTTEEIKNVLKNNA